VHYVLDLPARSRFGEGRAETFNGSLRWLQEYGCILFIPFISML
jgi:hypothetical protein